MNVTVEVLRVAKGDLVPGDTQTLRWQGFAEPVDGPSVGGCMVPGTRENDRFPTRFVVFATRDDSNNLTVSNRGRSSYFRANPAGRQLWQRLGRLARRRGNSPNLNSVTYFPTHAKMKRRTRGVQRGEHPQLRQG